MLLYKFTYPGDKKEELNQEVEKVTDKALSKIYSIFKTNMCLYK